MAGPFFITAYIGHLYEVQLSEIIKVYPVFVPKKLCKTAIDPLLEQINIPPSLIIVERIEE